MSSHDGMVGATAGLCLLLVTVLMYAAKSLRRINRRNRCRALRAVRGLRLPKGCQVPRTENPTGLDSRDSARDDLPRQAAVQCA
jgi:hypothetical protein